MLNEGSVKYIAKVIISQILGIYLQRYNYKAEQ